MRGSEDIVSKPPKRFFFLKEYAGAEGAYRTVIRQFPQEASVDYAYYQLGQAYYRRGNYNDAVSQFNELMKLFPKSSLADDAQYAIGWIWFQNKQSFAGIFDVIKKNNFRGFSAWVGLSLGMRRNLIHFSVDPV